MSVQRRGEVFLKAATVSSSLAGWRGRADVREAELLEDLADRALVVSDAEALGHDLLQVHRIGLEAGPLSELVRELYVLGIVVTLLETRQVRAALSAMIIKTDRSDPPLRFGVERRAAFSIA